MKVALVAEGAFELGFGSVPGAELSDDALGPAHILVRALLEELGRTDVRFIEPLHKPTGVIARGSDLQHERTFRQLWAWPFAERAPDLGVVLVDGDGEANARLTTLRDYASKARMRVVVGVAEHEFESWLIADANAARTALGRPIDEPPETLAPRAAKKIWSEWMAAQGGADERVLRRRVAELIDLRRACDRAPSLERLLHDLREPGAE